jgi:hypothetical protein
MLREKSDSGTALPLAFLAFGGLGVSALFLFSASPRAAILVADAAFCAYIAWIFRGRRASWLFLLHPPLLFACARLFDAPFLHAGDGAAYVTVVQRYIDPDTLALRSHPAMASMSPLDFLRWASLGVVPILLIPRQLFADPGDAVYYLWQGTFHVMLCALAVTAAVAWRAMNPRYLLPVTLVAVSPSFFDLTAAPTRHVVTFFAVFLFFVSYAALRQELSARRIAGLALSIACLVVSKVALLVPVLLFVGFDHVLGARTRLTVRSVLFLAGIAIAVTLVLLETFDDYADIAVTGGARFSGYAQLPVIGPAVRFVYALLAPFPWSKARYFIETIYSGNWLLFLMHVLSSLLGAYLFLAVLLNVRTVFRHDPELTRLLTYGLIMSLSIMRGAIGFHVYLLIYFPFLAPLLAIPQFRVSPLWPLGFAALTEAFVFLAR